MFDGRNTCPRDHKVSCLSPGPIDGGCCQVTPRDRPLGFSVHRRNPGHWDITTRWGRAFRIRGALGNVMVSDEHMTSDGKYPPGWMHFDTVTAAMAFCAAQLMHEAPDV
jgi:hypothetical protein